MKVEVDNGGILLTLLTVLFVALKLTHQIDWSWWWVLAPVWAPIALVLLILAGVLAIVVLCGK